MTVLEPGPKLWAGPRHACPSKAECRPSAQEAIIDLCRRSEQVERESRGLSVAKPPAVAALA